MEEQTDQRISSFVHSCGGQLDCECGGESPSLENDHQFVFKKEIDIQNEIPEDLVNILPDHYHLVRSIGHGAMGQVFLAVDQRLNRKVAVKFLNGAVRNDADRMRRFNQEARSASALNHPNILTIHDIGERGGIQFIVSEFVDGATLGAHIARGRLPLLDSVNIAIQLASALSESHRAGIVHRDLKPENVMVRRDGSVKILDFGLAKDTTNDFNGISEFDSNVLTAVKTSPGLILGTPKYMSPEQARGNQLDGRTDIFSVGIIIFEMVTGRRPFEGDSIADIIAAVIGKAPRPLDEFLDHPPAVLARIIDRSLRKDRNERYSSMEQLLVDLDELKHELMSPTRSLNASTLVQAGETHPEIQPAAKISLWKWIILAVSAAIIILLFFWLPARFRPDSFAIKSSLGTVSITSWSSGSGELVAAASFSPDAKMVAFAATKSGSTEIWAKPTVGGDAIQVTKNGFYNQYPVWSPDGQEIAFFSSRGTDHGLWRAAFTGGSQKQVIAGIGSSARLVRWSKTGKMYFQDGVELYVVDDNTGQKIQVTRMADAGVRPRTIVISADESTIAFCVKENDLWKLKLQKVNSETIDEVASSNQQLDYVAFDNDNDSVVYSALVEGIYQIFKADIGHSAGVQLSNGTSDQYLQDVSSDGRAILCGSVNETSDLWMVDTRDLKQTVVANDVASEYWAEFSPDGKNVVYQNVTQTDRPFRGSVETKSLSGVPIVIAQSGFSPVWSPNGEWIAYFKQSENGISIWRVKPTGGENAKIVDGDINAPGYTATPYLKIGTSHFSWSPDSATIAYSSKKGGLADIWTSAVDGTRNLAITGNDDPSTTYCCPIWSVDGKYLTFTSQSSELGDSHQVSHRLWIYGMADDRKRMVLESKQGFRLLGFAMNGKDLIVAQKADPADISPTPKTLIYSVSIANGSRSQVNTLESAYFHNIHLSPDGTSIAFVNRIENVTALWTVQVNGAIPKKLVVENDPKVLFSNLSWSHDGRSIVFGKQTRTNLLSMLTR
jgi:serine/threonine protein kinase